ncbi:MAG: 1-(5-phosphoribosyl)-5-[(5-phosphoribosylamino)methylideneamino] imidazole-4-carboxamide isomerase [Bacteroidota bacterium]
MLLIFPSIEIRRGRCVQLVKGEPGSERTYSLDPVDMAVLWRGENAKTLHVVDMDAVSDGGIRNFDILKKMVEAVDIPIQVGGGMRDQALIRELFAIGIYRVVIGSAAVENPGLVDSLIKEFGARKIAISVESWGGMLRIDRGEKEVPRTPLDHILAMKDLGVCRVVYSSVDPSTRLKRLAVDEVRAIATQSDLRITVQGGIQNFQDLLHLQEIEKFGVDSVIIGQALYENRFPCQRLWRINETYLTDLGPTRRL